LKTWISDPPENSSSI